MNETSSPSPVVPVRTLLIMSRSQFGNTISPPVGLYKLAYTLNSNNFPCDVLSLDIDDITAAIERVQQAKYEIIGFSVTQWSRVNDIETIWQFKQAVENAAVRPLFIAGGQEAALNSAQWLSFGIDVVFLGFAEKALLQFCQQVRELGVGSPLPELVGALEGVCFFDGSGYIVVRKAPKMTQETFRQLSYINALAMDVPYERYWNELRQRQSETSLGSSFVFEFVRLYTASHCPRRCGFCNSQNFVPASHGHSSPITFLAASEVIDLVLHHIDKYGARGFFFSDDDFPIGTRKGLNRLREFCARMIRLKTTGRVCADVLFSCQARIADFLHREASEQKEPDKALLTMMKHAGFQSIAMGVETFSDRLLRTPSINKIGVTCAECRSVLEKMLEIGLTPLINIILGIPEATPHELEETLETAMHFVNRGCEINVTGPMYALSGAPLLGDPRYPVRYARLIHPCTREHLYAHDYFIPSNPKVARVSERYEEVFQEALISLAKQYGWTGKIIHKRVKNTLAIIVAARLLERQDLVKRFEVIQQAIIEKKTPGSRTFILPPPPC